jgi:hypothetical protein
MSKIVTEIVEANKKYAANFGERGNLALRQPLDLRF